MGLDSGAHSLQVARGIEHGARPRQRWLLWQNLQRLLKSFSREPLKLKRMVGQGRGGQGEESPQGWGCCRDECAEVRGNALGFVFADTRQVAIPAPAGSDGLCDLAKVDKPRSNELGCGALVEPTGHHVLVFGLLGITYFQAAQQLQLPAAQPVAPFSFVSDRISRLIELQLLGLAPAIQIPFSDEVLKGGPQTGVLDPNPHVYQTPRRVSSTPSDGANLIYGLPVGGDGLVAMLDAEVTQGALVEINAFSHCAQMREMVRPQSMYESHARRGLAASQVLDWYRFLLRTDWVRDFCHLIFDLR